MRGNLVLGHLGGDLVGDERGVRADDRHGALLVQVVDDLPDVGSHERLAAGEDHDRVADGDDIVDDGLDLVERQLAVVVAELRGRATVRAAQVAAPRDLPRDDARRLDTGALLVCERLGSATGTEAHGARAAMTLTLARTARNASRVSAGMSGDAGGVTGGGRRRVCRSARRRSRGQRGRRVGAPAHRDRHAGLAAASVASAISCSSMVGASSPNSSPNSRSGRASALPTLSAIRVVLLRVAVMRTKSARIAPFVPARPD